MSAVPGIFSNMGVYSFRQVTKFLFITCLSIFILTACGGGGSGSGKGDDDSLKLTSTVSTAVLHYEEDSYMGYYSIVIDVSDGAKRDFYIAATYDGEGLSDDINIDGSGGDVAVVYIKGKDGLAPGQYTGNLFVLACVDEDCNRTLSSPLTIPYSVTIHPIFKVNPSSINISVPFPAIDVSRTISVQLPAGADLYTVEPSEKWMTITNKAASSFDLIFNVLPVGIHRATINVSSGGKIIGLPVNYTITASELPSSQESLSIQDGAYDWTDYQGGQMHNGYAPVAIDTSKLSTRWKWPSDYSTNVFAAPVLYNNRAYLVYYHWDFYAMLVAFNENDGNMDWYAELARYSRGASSPVVGASGVYVLAAQGTENSFADAFEDSLNAFSVETGEILFKKSFSPSPTSEIPSYSIQDNSLYFLKHYGSDLFKLDLENGNENWVTEHSLLSAASPVVIADHVYLISKGYLFKYDKSSGEKLAEKNIGMWPSRNSDPSVPVVVNSKEILALSSKAIYDSENDKTLAYVSTDSLDVNWSVQGAYISEPVVGNGILYILNRAPLQLEARNVSDGSLLWTWAPDGEIENQFLGNILLTNNVLLISTNALTHAIDLETHKTSWAYHKPSVSRAMSRNGLLYLVAAETVIDFNPKYMQLVVLNTK